MYKIASCQSVPYFFSSLPLWLSTHVLLLVLFLLQASLPPSPSHRCLHDFPPTLLIHLSSLLLPSTNLKSLHLSPSGICICDTEGKAGTVSSRSSVMEFMLYKQQLL